MLAELKDITKETKIIGVSMLTSLNNEDLKKWDIILDKKNLLKI